MRKQQETVESSSEGGVTFRATTDVSRLRQSLLLPKEFPET